MPLRRIWAEQALSQFQAGDNVELTGEDFHHAFRVSKFRKGEEFELVDGGDEALRVKVIEIEKKSATVGVVGKRVLPQRGPPNVGLAICMPKWSTFEWIIEKSVELGADRILPLVSQHSYIRKPTDLTPEKRERLEKIARSALEQSGWAGGFTIDAPQELGDFVKQMNPAERQACLIAYEGASALPAQPEVRKLAGNRPSRVWGVVGAEGGFAEEEVIFLKSQGITPISLGSGILRAETACVTILSVLKYELGLMK